MVSSLIILFSRFYDDTSFSVLLLNSLEDIKAYYFLIKLLVPRLHTFASKVNDRNVVEVNFPLNRGMRIQR